MGIPRQLLHSIPVKCVVLEVELESGDRRAPLELNQVVPPSDRFPAIAVDMALHGLYTPVEAEGQRRGGMARRANFPPEVPPHIREEKQKQQKKKI